jgi:predicted Zn finger-like uncharacterized protein
LNVRCPHCSTPFRLPQDLLGPGGARVRCPSCSEAFVVDPHGVVSAEPASPAAPDAGAPVAADAVAPKPADPIAPEGSLATARQVVEELASQLGGEIEAAIARGTLFSEHGARIVEAYDRYRKLAGSRSDPAPFRQALRERWGIELTPQGGEAPPR